MSDNKTSKLGDLLFADGDDSELFPSDPPEIKAAAKQAQDILQKVKSFNANPTAPTTMSNPRAVPMGPQAAQSASNPIPQQGNDYLGNVNQLLHRPLVGMNSLGAKDIENIGQNVPPSTQGMVSALALSALPGAQGAITGPLSKLAISQAANELSSPGGGTITKLVKGQRPSASDVASSVISSGLPIGQQITSRLSHVQKLVDEINRIDQFKKVFGANAQRRQFLLDQLEQVAPKEFKTYMQAKGAQVASKVAQKGAPNVQNAVDDVKNLIPNSSPSFKTALIQAIPGLAKYTGGTAVALELLRMLGRK